MALNTVFSWFIKKRLHQIDLFRKYPLEVQHEVFVKLIENGEDTIFGKHHGFDSIKNYEQFNQQVPIQEYDDLKPYVDRLMSGEQNLLWPNEIKWFAKSSGTTAAKSKYIPVSKEALEDCHYKGGKDLLSLFINANPESDVYNGKSFVVGGSSTINPLQKDSYSGDLSAIIINNLPFWVEWRRVPDKSVALMSDWEDKIEKMAQATAYEDVTNIVGVPSWTLVLLRRILEITGKDSISEVWPNLQLYMHGGVSFKPYRAQFDEIMQLPKLKYFESYNASEGFFAIQDENDSEDLLLMLDYGIFFEFIESSTYKTPNQKVCTLADVEIGKQYVLVISTNAGLWRYVTGDTITFTQTYPFKIKVSGRTKSFINVFGEELIVENADAALSAACEKHHIRVIDYTAAPVYMQNKESGAHQWLIEFEEAPKDMAAFTSTLDLEICKLNSDYEAKRTANLTLQELKVEAVPRGSFYAWLKSKGKLGGQNKVPRLCNDRVIVDEFIGFLKSVKVNT